MVENTSVFLFVSVAVFVVLFCIFGVSGHLCVLVTLLHKCQWKDKSGLVLILSLTISDIIGCFCWGLGALVSVVHWHADMLHRWLPIPISMSWTSLCIHLIVMAINRFLAVCFPAEFCLIFTEKSTKRMIIFIWVTVLAFNLPYVTNCCSLYYDFDRLMSTYDFNHTMIWYSQVHGTICGTLSTIVPSLLYCCVAVRLCLWKRGNTQSDIDVSLCWQFFVILTSHLVATITFQMIPKVENNRGLNSSLSFLIPMSSAINLSINPVVYLSWNKTIKTAFKQMIKRENVVAVQPIQLNQLAKNVATGNQRDGRVAEINFQRLVVT